MLMMLIRDKVLELRPDADICMVADIVANVLNKAAYVDSYGGVVNIDKMVRHELEELNF